MLLRKSAGGFPKFIAESCFCMKNITIYDSFLSLFFVTFLFENYQNPLVFSVEM